MDDIEFSLDVEKRLVQYRSSTRLGQTDWDVEKNRYNQFVRMLKSYGGWEVSPLQKDLYIYKTPYRWIDLLLTKSSIAIENVADRVINQITMLSSDDKNENTQETAGLAREQLRRISATIDEVLLPLRESTNLLIDTLSDEPGFRELIKIQKDIQSQINSNLPIYMNQVEEFTTKVEKLFPSGKIIGSDNAKVVPLSPNVISTESNDIDNEDNSYETTLTQPSPQTSTIRLSNPFGDDIKVPTLKPDINFNSLLDKGDSNTVEKKKREKTIISADEFRNMKGINTKDEDTNKPWLSSSRNSLGKKDNSRGKQNNVDFLNNEGNEVETIMGYLDEDTENTRVKGTLNKSISRREPLIPASQLRSGRLQLGGTPTVADTEQWGWLDGV